MRITVKIGTSTLAHATGRLNIQRVEKLCKVLSDLKNAGHEIILVSSGAIGWVSASSTCPADRRICRASRRPPPSASAS